MKNQFIIGISALILGFVVGYVGGSGRFAYDIEKMENTSGVMDGMTAGGLHGKTGDALERAFLDEMIIHHEGAIDMAETLLSGTKRPELIKLGNDIITAQTGEIEMMKQWRSEWFGR